MALASRTSTTEDLPDECLSFIFSTLSKDTGGYCHALVCKRWCHLAPQAQLSATILPKRALSTPVLLSQLRIMSSLTSLHLSVGSLQLLTDRFLIGLGAQSARLEHLYIAQQAAPVSCFNAGGLQALFQGCPRLRTCRLHTCGDVVELPDSLTGLQHLESLEFGSWTGSYSWRTYPNLTCLPSAFGSLSPSLRKLTLVSRSLHALPPSFTQLTGLTELNLHSVELGDLPQDLGKLTSLRRLRVRSQLLSALPRSLGSLKHLQLLCLNFCNCLFELPHSFGQLEGLQQLEIINCYALLHLPRSFSSLTNLQKLTIHGCAHLGNLPESLHELVSLRSLSLKFARRLRWIPSSIGRMESLESLEIQTCDRIESLPASIGDLSRLKALTVSGCHRISGLPETLSALTSLTSIEISECSGLKTVPPALKHLPSLSSCVIRDISRAA